MRKAAGMLALLLLVGAVFAILRPRFLSEESLGNIGRQIGLQGILALAAGLVILSGGIDLSLGSVVAFAALLFVFGVRSWNWPLPAAWGLALGAAAATGALQGFLVAGFRLPPFIVTLCGLLIVRGVARFLTEDQTLGLGAGDPSLTSLVEGSWLGLPGPLWILGGLALVLAVLVHGSVAGRHLFAIGSNEEAARLSGVPVFRLKVFAYALSGLLAGFAGILFLIYSNSVQPANMGQGYELNAIAAAVLGGVGLRGGTGTIAGVLVGTALIAVLMRGTNLLGIPTYLDTAVVGTAILAGVLLDEAGRRWTSR